MKIKFVGNEISPSRVPIRELIDLLRDLERGLLEVFHEDSEDGEGELSQLSLERLEPGSLALTFSTPGAPGVLETLSTSVARRLSPSTAQSADHSSRLVNTLRSFNQRYQCHTLVFRHAADVQPLVEFTEATPASTADWIEETTSVFGVLERVGGAKPKAWLRTETGERIICRLGDDRVLAQELAQHLYREVGISGRAVLDLHTGEIVELFAEELNYVDTPITESFERLEQVLPWCWRDVDVMAVIRKQRAEYRGDIHVDLIK